MSRHRADLREVEQSPDGRYVRFDEKLGNGAYKEVYLSYDTETGKEVAWNTVEMRRLPSAEKRRIRSETEILAELQHPHIINFYHVWENLELDQICFTTEIVTSGTLKQYTSRLGKGIKLKVIKKWCRQILTALDYLHSHDPPIIHRDLKCDNIFINGGTGEIRLGDFGLSAHRTCTHVASVLGTPEFMAPELYEENYSESVDIYAFGMCVLEMTSKEYPYEECSNAAQIWKKVTGGQKPDVLQRVQDVQVRQFIELCICPQEHRLSASELLAHPFLSFRRSDSTVRDDLIVTVMPRSRPASPKSTRNASSATKEGNGPSPTAQHATGGVQPKPATIKSSQPQMNGTHYHPLTPQAYPTQPPRTAAHPSALPGPGAYGDGPPASAPPPATSPTGVTAVMVDIESASGPTANIVLHIHLDPGRRKKQIKFALDFRHDTSMSLAGDMVQSLKLPDGERTQMMIASAMEARIDPVRKQYFAHMAEENVSPTSADADDAESTRPQLPVFQHSSYTTSTAPSTPSNAAAPVHGQSQGAAQTANGQRAAYPPTSNARQPIPSRPATALPNVSKPGPTQQVTVTSPLPPLPGTSAHSYPRAQQSPTAMPISSVRNETKAAPVAGTAHGQSGAAGAPPSRSQTPSNMRPPTQPTAVSRPSTANPSVTSRQSLPAQSTTTTIAPPQNGHRHSNSQPFEEPISRAVLPPSSPTHTSVNTTRSSPHQSLVGGPSEARTEDGLLTLDAFNSSEEYEAYLACEFKCLSVSVLKEKLRHRPGGTDLVKACFEKPDLIQMLIRITVQEHTQRQHGGATSGAKTSTAHANGDSAVAKDHAPRPHQSFSDAPDFLSPEPSSSANSPRSPLHAAVVSSALDSPDPFLGLDGMLGATTAQPFAGTPEVGQASHRFAQSKKSANTPPPDTITMPAEEAHGQSRTHTDGSHHHHHHHHHLHHHSSHHSIDSLSTLTPTVGNAFPFSPADPFSASTRSRNMSDAPSEDIPDEDQPSAFDFQVSVTTPAATPDVGLDTAVDFLSPTESNGTQADENGTIASTASPAATNTSSSSYDLFADAPLHAPRHHARTPSQDRSRVRLGPSLGGVLEDASEVDHAADGSTARTLSGAHRLAHRESGSTLASLTDLLSDTHASSHASSGGLSAPVSATPPRRADLDQAFFGRPHTSESDHARGTKTLPANFSLNDLDIFSPTADPVASGISATGTRASRAHTAADVDTFDPFAPTADEQFGHERAHATEGTVQFQI